MVDEDEIARLGGHVVHHVDTSFSARNRFEGVVTSVEVTGVIAQVEIEAGPHHIVSVITRDAVEELGLRPGVHGGGHGQGHLGDGGAAVRPRPPLLVLALLVAAGCGGGSGSSGGVSAAPSRGHADRVRRLAR